MMTLLIVIVVLAGILYAVRSDSSEKCAQCEDFDNDWVCDGSCEDDATDECGYCGGSSCNGICQT